MKRASNHQTNNLSTSGCFLFLCLIIRLTVNGLLLWGRPVFQGILSHFRLFRCIIASLEEVVAVGQFACKSITRRFLNMILRVFSQFFLLSSFTLLHLISNEDASAGHLLTLFFLHVESREKTKKKRHQKTRKTRARRRLITFLNCQKGKKKKNERRKKESH